MATRLKILKTAVMAVSALMLSGIPATTAALAAGPDVPEAPEAQSKAAVALSKLVRASKADTVKPVLELRNALRQAQTDSSVDYAAVAAAARKALRGVQSLRDGLQALASEIQGDDEAELYYFVVISYYEFKGLLQTAFEAHGDKSGLNASELSGLDLVVRAEVANRIAKFQGQEAAKAELDAFNIGFLLVDAGSGLKRLVVNAREASVFRMGAFMAYPDEATAKKALTFEALKLVFARQAMLKSYLYSDERVDASLPEGADPALLAMKTQADAVTHEAAYRKYVTGALVRPLSDAMAAGRKNFTEEAHKLFALLAGMFLDKVDQKQLARFGGTTDAVADKFIQLEAAQRAEAIATVLKGSSLYLTEMSRADLRSTLVSAMEDAMASLVLTAVGKGMIDLGKFSQKDWAILMVAISKFVHEAAATDAVSDQLLAGFEKSRGDFEVITSFRRYELATKILAAVEWLEGANGLLKKIEGLSRVPADLIPRTPNVGMALLAVKPAEEMPVWLLEVLQSVGSKVANVPGAADRRSLEGILRSAPERLFEIADLVRREATDGVLGSIQALHRSKLAYRQYRWQSQASKIRTLGKRVQSASAKKVLAGLLKMNELADKLESGSLRDKIRETFNGLVEGDTRNLGELITEIERGRAFVKGEQFLIQKIFAGPAERNEFLRTKLADPEIFKSYLGIHVQQIQNSFPLLFAPLPLASGAAKRSGNDKPIVFSELVIGLKKALSLAGADMALAKNALSGLGADTLKDRAALDGPARSKISPQQLVVGAMSGSWTDPELRDRIMDFVVDRFMSGNRLAPHDDSYWPQQFRVRDVMPAYFDDGTSLKVKAQRIAVSALLAPYLKSAAVAARDESLLLLKPGTDHTKAMAQSEAYGMLAAQTGDDTADGLSELRKKEIGFKLRLQEWKKYTTKTQEFSNYLFYETLFLNVAPDGHLVAGAFMCLSAFADFSTDLLLFVDYWRSYSALRPFSQSGVLGKGLVTHSEVEQIRQEMYQMGEVLVHRAPMDLYFFTSFGHDMLLMTKGWFVKRKVDRELDRLIATGQIQSKDEFNNDFVKLGTIYQVLGLDLTVSPEQFRRLYEERARALFPKRHSNPKARAELEYWVLAGKQTKAFTKKYGAIFDMLAGGSKN